MADKLGIGTEVRNLRLGDSFRKNNQTSFHTNRYDFKPASVDVTKVATVDIGQGNQVTVTVPHVEGSRTNQTVFKGNKGQYTKECVLIIDPVSGEITLERLTNQIQVKKTRVEGSSKAQQGRPITPVDYNSHKKPSPSEKHSPSQKNPVSPNQKLSPYQMSPTSRTSPPHQIKMPSVVPPAPRAHNHIKQPSAQVESSMPSLSSREAEGASADVGVLSDSSSGSSSSGSSSSDSSDSDSDNEMEIAQTPAAAPVEPAPPPPLPPPVQPVNPIRHSTNHLPSMPHFSQLSEDLQLSESGSDSD